MCLNSKWHNENKQKFHINGYKFLFILIKSLWTLKWTTGFFLLTRNYVLKMFITLFALQPLLHLLKLPLWAVVLFYATWMLMTLILRKHFPIQEFTFKALMAQESGECLWGDIWQDTQHWPLVGHSCIESVLIFVLKLHQHFMFEED